MKSRPIISLGLILGVGLCGSPVAPTHAANINVHGASCQISGISGGIKHDDLVHTASFGTAVTALPPDVQWRWVVCSVPRSPLLSGATSASFYVDGFNLKVSDPNTSTECVLLAINFNGVVLASVGFTATEARYDQLLTLPASALPMWAYTALECKLPITGNGALLGVTSLQ